MLIHNLQSFNKSTEFRLAFKNIYLLLRPDATALLEFLEYHRGFESYIAKSKIPRYMPYMQVIMRKIK